DSSTDEWLHWLLQRPEGGIAPATRPGLSPLVRTPLHRGYLDRPIDQRPTHQDRTALERQRLLRQFLAGEGEVVGLPLAQDRKRRAGRPRRPDGRGIPLAPQPALDLDLGGRFLEVTGLHLEGADENDRVAVAGRLQGAGDQDHLADVQPKVPQLLVEE